MSPKTDNIKPDSRKKPYQKPQLRHYGTIAQLARQLEEGRAILIHPQTLSAIAHKCQALAVAARADGDATQDAEQMAAYYAYADKCASVGQQLYELAAGMTAIDGDWPA